MPRSFLPLTVLFLALAALPAHAADTATARVTAVEGIALLKAYLADPGRPLVARQKLGPGAFIETEGTGWVTVELPGTHTVTIGRAPTLVRWSGERLNTVSLTVYRGRTEHRVTKLGRDGAYQVSTPVSTAGVRGTEFTVEVGDNGAARTAVSGGTVSVAADDGEVSVEKGEADERYLVETKEGVLEGKSRDEAWLAAQKVTDTTEASQVEEAAAARMREINRLNASDYLEMAELAAEVASFALRKPSDLGDAADAVDLLQRGLVLYRRLDARDGNMEAQYVLTQGTAQRFGLASTASDSEYRAYAARRG